MLYLHIGARHFFSATQTPRQEIQYPAYSLCPLPEYIVLLNILNHINQKRWCMELNELAVQPLL